MQLQPEDVDFGVVHKGITYIRHVQLHNIGVHSSRYRIKTPPRSLGINIQYSPGLVCPSYHQIYVQYRVAGDFGEVLIWKIR